MTLNIIQSDLLNKLSFPVPEISPCAFISVEQNPERHLNPNTSYLLSQTIHQGAVQHLPKVTVSTPLTEREVTLLKERNDLADGLKVTIGADPTDVSKQVITVIIDYNRALSKKIFVAPTLPAEQKVEINQSIIDTQERMNQYKDMDIMVNGESVLSINYTQLIMLTKNSIIESVINMEGRVKRNEKGRIEVPVPRFNEHPKKAKPFMEMVLNQSVPSHLSIEDISIYLDWAGMIGASNTKAALLNLLVKHPGLEEFCGTRENRQNLRVFSQTGDAPEEVKKFIQEYVLFYGNTRFDQLSLLERRELEIFNNPHYRGNIDGRQAGKILEARLESLAESPARKSEFHYLLRTSVTEAGAYTITFISSSNNVRNIRFSIDEEGKLSSTGSTRKYDTLNELIQFAQKVK